MISPDDLDERFVPRGRTDVASVEIDGDVVLYDERTGNLHAMNPSAGVVWARCDGSASVGQLIDELGRDFPVERSVLAADVVSLVRHLARLGVLEGLSTTPPPPPGAGGKGDGEGESPFAVVPPSP